MTIRTVGDGLGGVKPHEHDASEIFGDAVFVNVRADNILAGTIDAKEIIVSGGTDGLLKSSNFSTGSAGWAIFGDGSAEFQDVTIVGTITAGAGSDVDWSFISNVSVENADIVSLTFDKITAATNDASLVIGASGTIESANYSAGSAGFHIGGDGNAEFNDVTVRGNIQAGTGSDVDWQYVSSVSVATADIENLAVTNAKINTVTATKLTAGTISAQEIILSNSSSSILRSSGFSAGSAGWRIRGTGDAEFNDIVVRGDLVSGNWDGTDPPDLSSGADGAATAGWALDSSEGAAQFTGPVYFSLPDESTPGSGEDVLQLGEGFFFRVYKDNPTLGEDTLWIGASTDATDRIVIGPTSASSELKSLQLGALSIPMDFGAWSHTFPTGLIYDWDSNTDASGSAGTTETTKQTVTLSVPANVSVTVFAWAIMRYEHALDNNWTAMRTTIGGTAQMNPMLTEHDLTTGSGGDNVDIDGSSSSEGGHNHAGEVTAFAAHSHTSGSYAVNGTHTHAMGSQWTTLTYCQMRSYTPTGSTVDVDLNAWCESSTQSLDNSLLMAMVFIN